MPRLSHGNIHAYKDITFQQLRSFFETVRLGSLTAAAASLGLTHPTVWKQVHALEQRFGLRLVEAQPGHGCRPTKAGRVLAELASPLVLGIGSLEQAFRLAQGKEEARLVVVAPPRVIVEDLPECILEFEKQWPDMHFSLQQVSNEEVAAKVASGQADLGLTDSFVKSESQGLTVEPIYSLDMVLVTPRDHPLARRRRIEPQDLCSYPLVNAAMHPNPTMAAALEILRTLGTRWSCVEVFFVEAICRYVELGFGIGLFTRPAAHASSRTHLHERVLSHLFGLSTVYLVRRKGDLPSELATQFAETVKTMLKTPENGSRKARS